MPQYHMPAATAATAATAASVIAVATNIVRILDIDSLGLSHTPNLPTKNLPTKIR